MSRALLCAFLSILLCCAPLGVHVAPDNPFPSVNVERNEAHAIAPVAVAGGAALAAELGISTEALMAALAAMFAAGTGVYLLNSSDYSTSGVALDDYTWRRLWNGGDLGSGYQENWSDDYAKYKVGGSKSWDELSDEEKANWSSPAEYVQSQWVGLLATTGLLQESTGGGFEPTPEPEDPEEKKRWFKSRNALTALAVGTGAVALSDAVSWLGDTIGGGIHDLIFGETQNTFNSGMGYTLQQDISVAGHPVYMRVQPVTLKVNNEIIDYTDNWLSWEINGSYYQACGISTDNRVIDVNWYNGGGWWKSNTGYNIYLDELSHPTGYYTPGGGGSGLSWYCLNGHVAYFNASYIGTYRFASGTASLTNGVWSGDYNRVVNYPVITDTPDGLKDAVATGGDTWNDYISNDTNSIEGQKKTVTVPTSFDGVDYTSFIGTVPDGEETPIPDDSAVPTPEPEPEPPYDSTQFQEDYGKAVQKLLQQPFDQLFPFCLIGDLQRYVDIMTSQFVVENGDGTLSMQAEGEPLNGTETLKISLAAFNVYPEDSAEYWEFDLRPLHDLALSVRYMLTGLFVVGLLIGTFSYFLKRGGH